MGKVAKATITGADQWSDTVRISDAKFSVSVQAAAMSATVVLQRKLPDETTWGDVKSYTAAAEEIGESIGTWDYRIGVKSGGFTSATGLRVALVY